MIQFNLLPDIKLQYIRTRRQKRLVMLIATLVTGASLTVMILLLLVVHVFQKQHLQNISDDIARDSKILQDTPDIEKILTVQNQLSSLPQLHSSKPVTSRLFRYIKQVTPPNVSIARIDVNFLEGTASITGQASSLGDVNVFIDTLKFTEYTQDNIVGAAERQYTQGEHDRAFFDVVLGTFNSSDSTTAYTVNFKFKQEIFMSISDDPATTDVDESGHTVLLIIPNIVTTRSQLDKPNTLFQPLEPTGGEN